MSTSTSAVVYASQQEWLSLFSSLGIEFVDPAGVRLLAISEGLEGIIESCKQNMASHGWVEVLSGAAIMPEFPHPILSMLARQFFNLVLYDQLLGQEEQWRLELVALIKDLLDSDKVALVVPQVGTPAAYHFLGQPRLRRNRPDFSIGISRTAIQIVLAYHPDRPLPPATPLTVNEFLKTPSMAPPEKRVHRKEHYFSYVFAGLNSANGSADEGRISVTTACCASLHALRTIARRARRTAPFNFRPPPPGSVLSRSYGLQTEAGGKSYRLSVVRASDDWESWGSPSSFKVGTLWRGDLTDPRGLIELYSIVQYLQRQAAERLNYIANWLWSLEPTRYFRDNQEARPWG